MARAVRHMDGSPLLSAREKGPFSRNQMSRLLGTQEAGSDLTVRNAPEAFERFSGLYYPAGRGAECRIWSDHMPVPFAPLLLGAQITFVAAGGPPTINVQRTCRTSEATITEIFGNKTVATYDTCMRQENEALDQLRKNWGKYPSADKARCIQTSSYMPSYVEWLTCFEMERDVRAMRQQNG
jgi:hypothetical protein